jgi:TolA-binding protein
VDCEQLDRISLDLLYEEASDYEGSAARQHLGHCARCNALFSRLKSANLSAEFKLLEPRGTLAQEVLKNERSARSTLGFGQRLGRWLSIVAGYAMRPQVGMGALFLLMIGASLLFLRATPGSRDSVFVTERGIPESEPEQQALSEAQRRAVDPEPDATTPKQPAAPSEPGHSGSEPSLVQAAGGHPAETNEASFSAAMAAYEAHHYKLAAELFDRVALSGDNHAAEAELLAAQALLKGRGCAAAAPRFDAAIDKGASPSNVAEATWQAANCHLQLGNRAKAIAYYSQLKDHAQYGERAARSLQALEAPTNDAHEPAETEPAGAPTPP